MNQTRTETNIHILPLYLEPNKFFPNNKFPVLLYKSVFIIPSQKNKAADIIQNIFLRNDWGNTWRNGIYDFHHYHSNTHECLGIAAGSANVILGGPNGRRINVEQGDLLILPAGTGHRCTRSSENFVCVGGYPEAKDYDINHGTEAEFKKASMVAKKVPAPKHDPVFGKQGFLKSWWK